MSKDTFNYGDLVRCTGTFTNSAGTAIDPVAVLFKFKNPAGTITAYTYGVGADITKSSTGIYYVDINANASGTWFVRWYSTGTGQAAEEDEFYVSSTKF